jgi:hypothetical protein
MIPLVIGLSLLYLAYLQISLRKQKPTETDPVPLPFEFKLWKGVMELCEGGVILVPVVLFGMAWGISDGAGGANFDEKVFLWYVGAGVPLLVVTGGYFVKTGIWQRNLDRVRLGALMAWGTLIPGIWLAREASFL